MIYFIGIDIGTTGAKAILMTADGIVVSSFVSEYPMLTPRPLWSEQNPDDWWSAACSALKGVVSNAGIKSSDIRGIGLTGQMHGLVTLDKNAETLYPCIMWNDQRTERECKQITELIGSRHILSITGNQVLPGFTAPKLLWLRNHLPDIYNRIYKILLPKDYIRFKLTGEFYTDVSDASGTALLNTKERKWSDEIVNKLEIDKQWLPHVSESALQTGRITKEAAELTGLPEGLPVFAGGGDQAAGAVGCGAVKEGIISIVLGTSGVVFTHSDNYRVEPQGRLHAFCHAVDQKWHLMGVTLSAAGSFRWYRDTFCREEINYAEKSGKDVYELLTSEAERVKAGSEGLFFLPYLTGERTPYADPSAKGTFTGISIRHSKAHFTRALLEGVAYSLRDCYTLISDLGIEAQKIVISGGGARSKLWRGIIADIFDAEISTLTCTEGAPYGAAILAATGSGSYSNVVEACNHILKTNSVETPDKNNVELYRELYPVYQKLYPQLKNTFLEITKIIGRQYGN